MVIVTIAIGGSFALSTPPVIFAPLNAAGATCCGLPKSLKALGVDAVRFSAPLREPFIPARSTLTSASSLRSVLTSEMVVAPSFVEAVALTIGTVRSSVVWRTGVSTSAGTRRAPWWGTYILNT